jgi:hypothetical protein
MTPTRVAFALSLLICSLLLALAPSDLAAANFKKYDIKSGIVTYDVVMSMGSMEIKSKQIVYFDEYGLVECQEEFSGGGEGGMEINTVNFVKDGIRYSYSPSNRRGMKSKAMGSGVAARFDAMDMSAAQKTEYHFKELGSETICGRPCDGVFLSTSAGDTKTFGWNHIMLRIDVENAKMSIRTSTVAVKVEENVAIPAEKFTVPADVVMTAR